jgi:hypothetical protein
MKKIIFALFLWFFSENVLNATDYYVKQGNSTSNNGTSVATAAGLKSNGNLPNSIANNIQPGDFIYLIGTFTNPSYTTTSPVGVAIDDPRFWHGENTILLNNLHGSAAGGYITIKPYDNTTLLKGDGGNIFRVQNSSYLKIEGFNIQGEVDNLPLSVANALQFVYILNTASSLTDPAPADIKYRDQDCVSNCTAGAVVDGEVYSSLNPNNVYRPTYYDTRGMYLSDVHHIDILNNHIHHMPGGGLRVSDCEDILIQGNEINDCSRRSSGGTHGLVVTKATSTRTSDDYRIQILRNLVHHNYNEQYSWAPDKTEITPHIDEGKGISLQRNQTTSSVNWDNGRILIANNICYYNGFSGIHSNDGYRIDIINNSCYFNSYTKSVTEWTGTPNPNGGNIGISLSDGTGHKIINNIVVIDNNMTRSAIATNINTTSNPSAITVKNNIIYGNTSALGGQNLAIEAIQVNTQNISPQWVDQTAYNFNLLSTSPAINAADAAYAPTIDYYGNTRTSPDIGAVEYQSVLPVELLSFSGQNTEGGNLLTWQTANEVNNKGFSVERKKATGDSWYVLGFVVSNSKSATYNFTDNTPLSISSYRLRQIDNDGKETLSKVITIQTNGTKGKLAVYPNPVSNILTVHTEGSDFQILNLLGQQVMSGKAPFGGLGAGLDVSALPQGSYVLKVGSEQVKFIKQ